MLFTTRTFAVFLVFVLAVYYRLGHQGRLNWLLAASILFYGLPDPRMLALIGASIVVGWGTALKIDESPDRTGRRAWFVGSLVFNLGFLFFFKYYDFTVRSVAFWSELAGFSPDLTALRFDILLPVGISFYTFQIVSYSADVYLGRFKADKNLRDFALYVLFFPQLVAGPVERASHLLPQYKVPVTLEIGAIRDGVFLILLGLVKKMILGDRIAAWIAPQFADPLTDGWVAWASVILFTTQIYVDFSAYSDIAIGLGRLMGYDIRPNFDFPFLVPSIPERWRRWHLSMGAWFRDYVYFPLGGNRHGEARTSLNLMIVMFLSGLWHGASYNFVVWGLLNGSAMVLHRWMDRPILEPIRRFFDRGQVLRWGYFYLCCAVTFLTISSINIFFRSDDWPVARSYVEAMFLNPIGLVADIGRNRLPSGYGWGFAFFAITALAHEAERHFGIKARILARPAVWGAVAVFAWILVLGWAVRGENFIYFQF